jgi:hypothetical protein
MDDAQRRAEALFMDERFMEYARHIDAPAMEGMVAEAIRGAAEAEREQVSQLVRDLWRYATGKEWGELSEERAAANGDTLAALHQRVSAMLDGKKTEPTS